MSEYFNDILLKFKCEFRKGHGAKHTLLFMVEKTRKIPHNKGVFAAVLADLSKAFDSISNAFPIAKLNAYDFDKIS